LNNLVGETGYVRNWFIQISGKAVIQMSVCDDNNKYLYCILIFEINKYFDRTQLELPLHLNFC
jgi:hypothetical protein